MGTIGFDEEVVAIATCRPLHLTVGHPYDWIPVRLGSMLASGEANRLILRRIAQRGEYVLLSQI